MEKGFTKFLQGKNVIGFMQKAISPSKKPETPGLAKMEKYLLDLSDSIDKSSKARDIQNVK